MCRSIRVLSKADPPASHDDVNAAALQFVRKIGGFARPSRANEASFEAAVTEITLIAEQFLETIEIRTKPRTADQRRAAREVSPRKRKVPGATRTL